MFLLYKTDKWLTLASKELLLISDTKEEIMKKLTDYFMEQDASSPYPLQDDNIEIQEYELLEELDNEDQTQGYDTNYIIEEFEKNEFLTDIK
jgi:hypothetical protein